MGEIYTTMSDLQNSLADAFGDEGTFEGFDMDTFTTKLSERGAIVSREFDGQAQRNGFELVTDENGNTPGFWELYAEMEQRRPVRYLGQAEVAREAGLQKQTVRDLRIRGRLPEPDAMTGVHPGWLPETIERWLQETGRVGR